MIDEEVKMYMYSVHVHLCNSEEPNDSNDIIDTVRIT